MRILGIAFIRRRCAWCRKGQGWKLGRGTTGTSHGICPKCEAKLTAQMEAM
jgi:hypothetical protein